MNYFDFIDRKTAPKPSHRRLPPSRTGRPAITQERVLVRNAEPKPEPIEVTEGEASDSMILMAFKFWQR
jgi:hypothetical protein